ncbi:MAG: hypothetical protein JXR97_11670 [Planctomycetes bacterium]|nr:hypothetical protein [Planctomycetota bacterium]
MDCNKAIDEINRVIDEGLPLEESLSNHLRTCGKCSDYYMEMQSIDEKLAASATSFAPRAPEGLEARIISAIGNRNSRKPEPEKITHFPFHYGRFAAAACFILLTMGASFLVWQHKTEVEKQNSAKQLAELKEIFTDLANVNKKAGEANEEKPIDSALYAPLENEVSKLTEDTKAAGRFFIRFIPFSSTENRKG